MTIIRLAIRGGGYVADVSIPPFQRLPDIIVWGSRHFTFHAMLPEPEDHCAAEYREGFAYFVPPDFATENEEK
jgi:hypothetical protein